VCGMITVGATSLLNARENRIQFMGIMTALSVALVISFYTLVDGAAVQNGSSLSYGLLMFTLVPLLTTPYNIRRYGWRRFSYAWKEERNPIILAGVLGVTAYLIALFAYTLAPVGYSGSIRQVSVVIGAFLGWRFLGEKMGGMRVVGAVVIFSGILVIAIFG